MTLAASRGALLRLGNSCHKYLVWECELGDKSIAARLPECLLRSGYTEPSRSGLVRELVHPAEHSVVVVPRTGRVQIRVHYLTPLDSRKARATEIAGDIVACTEVVG